MSADDCRDNSCCVCGCAVVVKVTDSPSLLPSTTCSVLCQQVCVFLQGLVCGHALGRLLGRCEGENTPYWPVKFAESRRVCDELFDKQTLGCVKTESNGKSEKRETDLESNHGEELLQVIFDPDCPDKCSDGDSESSGTDVDMPPSLPPESRSPLIGPPSAVNKSAPLVDCQQSNGKLWGSMRATWPLVTTVSKSDSVERCVAEKARKMTSAIVTDSAGFDYLYQKTNSNNAKRQRKLVECDVCGKSFIESHLYVHMRAKHSDKLATETGMKLSCSECHKTFDKKSNLNKHFALKHLDNKKLTKSCTFCHKNFASQIGLSVHMRQAHQALSPKECDMCQKTFQSCKELSRHKLHDHKLRAHVCHLCGKKFAYSHALRSHLDAHAGVKKHFCEVCGEGFVRMTSLCGHRVSAHSKKDTVFKCMLCDFSYNSKGLLNKHLFESHLTGPYAVKDYRRQLSVTAEQSCQLCKMAAEDSESKCPVHCATGDKPQFICSHCGKKFSRSHYLKAHEKQHQVARFSCDICCKRFTYKCNLKAHRSTHSSDKPFQCSVCPKTFRLKFLLEDHQRLHNQEALFKCYVCGRGLTRIPNLKRHIKVMHPEVNYELHYSDTHQQKNLPS